MDRGARRRHRRSAASDVDERGLGRGSTTSSSDYSSSDDEDEVGGRGGAVVQVGPEGGAEEQRGWQASCEFRVQ